jgi:rubredoxin
VYEDKAAARETLDRVRAFCRARPTVYLGTHTPEALESHAQKRVVDLDNPPAVIPVGEIVFKTPTGKYICSVCGYVYDPAEHDGVAFEDLPADWRCLRCKQPKEKFNRA